MSRKIIICSTHVLDAKVMAAVRLRRLLSALKQQGWEPVCLCPDAGQANLLKMLRKFLYTVSAASKAIQISRQGKGIILLATIPDIESLLAGAMVKMIVGSRLTFILEVRDPFSLNKALPWGPVKRWIGRTLEGFLLRWPDRAVFLTPEIERMYLNSFESKGAWLQNHRVITNGFDPAEYAPHSRGNGEDRLVMTYVGHFYDRRNPILFLRTLAGVLANNRQIRPPIVHFVGVLYGKALQAQVQELIRTEPLRACIQWHEPVPHQEAIAMIQKSDVNLIITHDQGSEYAIPGKLFEYMGAGRPVLALTRDPLVEDLIRQTHLGWLCEDADALRDWFEQHLSDPESIRAYQPDWTCINRYRIESIHQQWMEFVGGSLAGSHPDA